MNAAKTLALVVLTGLAAARCAQPDGAAPESVATAWSHGGGDSASRTTHYRERPTGPPSIANRPSEIEEPLIARVQGKPITRREVVELLMGSHGLTVLEQLVGLEAARAKADELGVEVSDTEVEEETARALRRLVDPLSPVTEGQLDRDEAERVLRSVLDQRNLSRKVFRIVMRRNAILRKIVLTQTEPTEAQLREEYQRAYGPRVRVRHIQLATPAEVVRMQERLADGAEFSQMARRYSANQLSAQDGGLLAPFTQVQDELPKEFRDTAFALREGEVSDAVRVGEWYHLIRLEKRLPAGEAQFASVRSELEQRLLDRLGEEGMFDLYRRLFREATIEIYEPELREAFNREHGEVAE